MDEPLESVYFNWLYNKVARVAVPTPSLTYFKLFRELHNTEFVWLVSGDDNRAEDGIQLRTEFFHESYIRDDSDWSNIGCSVLEMLIAFSRRASFEYDDWSPRDWFWVFLENLGLADLNDARSFALKRVRDILDRLIWRTYDPNGYGGMFTIINTHNDQRKEEIWSQFCEYLFDQDLM